MLIIILAFLLYVACAAMFVITDDTTFGIWMIVYLIILYGTIVTLTKEDE